MSIYDLPTQRRRRGGRRVLAVLLCAGGLLAGVLYLNREAVSSYLVPAPSPGAGPLLAPGPPLVRAGCVDTTGSSSRTFWTSVLGSVADGLAGWAGPANGDTLPARPELHLVLRTVSTTSSATEGQVVLDRTVPAVPGLVAVPPVTDPDYTAKRHTWDEAASRRAQAWRVARDRTADLADEVRHLPVPQGTSSAISGCLAAAAQSTAADSGRALLLASDLIENEPPTTADYGGSPVLLVVSCPAADPAACPGRIADWSARLKDQKAGQVQPVRSDAAADDIEKWVRGA